MYRCRLPCLFSQTHFRALFRKRFRYALRDKKAVCFQLVIPIIALMFGLLLIKTAPIHVPPEAVLSVHPFNDFGSSRLPLEVPYWGNQSYAAGASSASTRLLQFRRWDLTILGLSFYPTSSLR